jgi:hypothetical protein
MNLDDANTLDMRRHVAKKRKAERRAYDVENEIDGEVVGGFGTMSIDDYEFGSMIAAMEEVMNLPQGQYTGMIFTKEGVGDADMDGLRFNDGDEFDESEQDRVLVDCVIDGEDEQEENEAEEGDFGGLADSSDSESDSESDSGSGSSDSEEGSDTQEGDANAAVEVGEVCDEEEDPANKRADKIRSYLQRVIGPINFERAYSLMKVVETSEDDDAILVEMESIVGVEGLHLIDAFINLIALEDEINREIIRVKYDIVLCNSTCE